MLMCNKCGDSKPQSDFYPRNKVCKGCTIQRVKEYQSGVGKEIHNRCCREYNKSDKGRTALSKARSNYLDAHRVRQQARWAVKSAVRRGKLIRPNYCEACSKACYPDGHHADYTKQTDVTWLCQQCHVEWHKHHTPIYPQEAS